MGTVKRFNMEKGFGFIIPDDGGDDIFAHAMHFVDGNALRDGTRVCYRRSFDDRTSKYRAEELSGAYHDASRPEAGSGSRRSAPPAGYPPPQYPPAYPSYNAPPPAVPDPWAQYAPPPPDPWGGAYAQPDPWAQAAYAQQYAHYQQYQYPPPQSYPPQEPPPPQ